MAVFSLVYPLFGHAREGRIGLQRPRKPLKRKGPISVEFTPESADVCGCRQLGKLVTNKPGSGGGTRTPDTRIMDATEVDYRRVYSD